MDETKICQRALEKWGLRLQLIVAIEELSELQKALCKVQRPNQGSIDDVVEEIADVEIMIHQIRIGLGISDEAVQAVKDAKLKRVANMLDDENG